jgi:DNA-binding transcriptional MerR regulator
MPEKKSWGSTVVGWFLVSDSSAAGSVTVESASADDDLIRRAAGADPEALPVFTSEPPPAPAGEVDFEGVFEAAGITSEEYQRVTRTLELLDSLPPGTDDSVKRQIVMASLRAFGVPIEKIIESGAEELQALEAYIRGGARDAERVTSEGELQIRKLEEEISALRKAMQERVEEQRKVMQACNAKKLEVQRVLEFFGQDAVARVVHESPKLHVPAGEN